MAQTQAQTQTVTGEVEATNERGLKLGGRWLNYSKFSTLPDPLPEAGQTVALEVAKDRFINRVLAVDGVETAEAGPDPDEAPPVDDDDPSTWGHASGQGSAAPRPIRPAAPAPTPAPASAPAKAPSRATLKAAALAAAAHFLSGRPEASEDDLYSLAYRLAAWIEDAE